MHISMWDRYWFRSYPVPLLRSPIHFCITLFKLSFSLKWEVIVLPYCPRNQFRSVCLVIYNLMTVHGVHLGTSLSRWACNHSYRGVISSKIELEKANEVYWNDFYFPVGQMLNMWYDLQNKWYHCFLYSKYHFLQSFS